MKSLNADTPRETSKVAIVIGTRPEAIKMAPVYLSLKAKLGDRVELISTGQHREMLWQSA